MISNLACPSFSSLPCSTDQRAAAVRTTLRPLTQIKGLNRQCRELKAPTYNIPRRCRKASASSPSNLGEVENLISSKKESLTERSYSAKSDQGDASVQGNDVSTSLWTKVGKKLEAFYRFTRPYTIYGTIIGIISVSLLPVQTISDLSPAFFIGLLKAIIPTVLVNIYMVGINQLYDIGIDKINKPDLPLASGEFSVAVGRAVTAISVVSSFVMGVMINSLPLLIAIMTIFILSTAYSVDLPFLRWKKNAFLTSVCIISVRALVIPLCFFAHVQTYVLGRPFMYTKPVLFTVAIMTIIATVIGVIKDLPDTEGDEAFGLRPPSTVYGRETVFWFCVYALLVTYGGAAVLGATSPLLPNKIITVLAHGVLAAILWFRAKSVKITEPSETLSFYLFTWKLLYAEYLVIPFIRWKYQ